MTRLVDVVNFNADASCLSSQTWLEALEGGPASQLCRWLGAFSKNGKKVSIGFVGGAVADMVKFNPEAIALCNSRPDIFEVLLRPFSHDVALLRTPAGFLENLRRGRFVIEREFSNVVPAFLPAEFMLTNHQVKLLQDDGVHCIFINSNRFKDELKQLLPVAPYRVQGVLGASLRCIPFLGELTQYYLESLHSWDASSWNSHVLESGPQVAFSWRDGESPFLIPEGVEREDAWLSNESPSISRASLAEVLNEISFDNTRLDTGSNEQNERPLWHSYPVHSFTAWFKEFRMMGYVDRVRALEAQLDRMSPEVRILWLQAITSDVLSAVEKDSPVVSLRRRSAASSGGEFSFVIRRSERGFEGEEFLTLAEIFMEDAAKARAFLATSQSPHLRKLAARTEYFQKEGRAF